MVHSDDIKYVLKMVGIGVTFPISLPLIFLLEFLNDNTSVFDRPWKVREMKRKEELEKEEARKKTYAYKYSKN